MIKITANLNINGYKLLWYAIISMYYIFTYIHILKYNICDIIFRVIIIIMPTNIYNLPTLLRQ